MEFVYNLLVVTHLLAMCALIGGWIVSLTGASAPLKVIVWGARIQLLTGIVLVGAWEMGWNEGSPNHMKIGIKLLVAIGVAACAEIAVARARKNDPKPTLVNAAGGLAVLNALVAVLW